MFAGSAASKGCSGSSIWSGGNEFTNDSAAHKGSAIFDASSKKASSISSSVSSGKESLRQVQWIF